MSSAQASTDKVFLKACGLIHQWNLSHCLTDDETLRLKCFWGLLMEEEQAHLARWATENKGSLPPFLKIWD
jgi:hypothetical protein